MGVFTLMVFQNIVLMQSNSEVQSSTIERIELVFKHAIILHKHVTNS